MEKARERIREEAFKQAFVPPARLFLDQEFEPEVMAGLSRSDLIYDYIRRYRRPVRNTEPTERNQINLTDKQINTKDWKRFLFHDSNCDQRVLVFAKI